MSLTPKQQKARYYVYELIDPRTCEPFYIGKGTGKRAWTHEKAARRGKIDNAPKFATIRAIHDAGQEVVVHIVRDKITEAEAFALERQLIQENDELTNISGGCASNEERNQLQAREALSCMKTFNGWIATAHPERLAACDRVLGGCRKFYEDSLDFMLSMSGFDPEHQASIRASAFI